MPRQSRFVPPDPSIGSIRTARSTVLHDGGRSTIGLCAAFAFQAVVRGCRTVLIARLARNVRGATARLQDSTRRWIERHITK